ncbi:hypothetical protein S245_040906, partial [Arachis hypogaea]
TIPPTIFQPRGLVHLRLSKNKLSGPMPLSIQFSGLHELDLSSNKFSGPMLIDALALNRNLSMLDLSFNMIDNVIVTNVLLSIFPPSVIPVNIGYYMSRSLYLSLANNSFHGSIPHSLCNASMLEVLDLSHNKISGELPHCLMKIGETLWILNLGSNNLTGHIPNTFPSSCSLRTIVFNGNQLAGPLPNSLAH